MKIGLVTRGKWTSKNDISQDVHTHTHTHTYLKKWSFKILYYCQCFIHTWILLFLVCCFKTVYDKDLKLYFLESIHYMIYDLYWQYCNKVRMFSNGQQDSLQHLPTQG